MYAILCYFKWLDKNKKLRTKLTSSFLYPNDDKLMDFFFFFKLWHTYLIEVVLYYQKQHPGVIIWLKNSIEEI